MSLGGGAGNHPSDSTYRHELDARIDELQRALADRRAEKTILLRALWECLLFSGADVSDLVDPGGIGWRLGKPGTLEEGFEQWCKQGVEACAEEAIEAVREQR